ncbi:MAG: DNA repair protein RecO [Bacteroidales bacterium]|nr:DNA repair protein RecO [Bacteroidales bacterium]
MLQKTRGIVLHTIKYSDTSVIVRIYTEQIGLQSYLLRGVRKQKSKVKSNMLQHLTLVDLVVYYKEKSNLQNIKEIRYDYQFKSIPFDVAKSSIAMFLNEIIYRSIQEEEPNPQLFNFLYHAIIYLDEYHEFVNDFHLLFLVKLSRFLGFFPGGHYSKQAPYFDLQEGLYYDFVPGHPHYMDSPESEILDQLVSASFENPSAIKLTTGQRRKVLDKLVEYYRLHLPSLKEIKSHQILHTVLQ